MFGGGGGGGGAGSVKVNKDNSECLLGFNYAFMPVLVTSNYLRGKQRIRLVAFYRGNRLSFLFGLDRNRSPDSSSGLFYLTTKTILLILALNISKVFPTLVIELQTSVYWQRPASVQRRCFY